jgi:hypothetical protein
VRRAIFVFVRRKTSGPAYRGLSPDEYLLRTGRIPQRWKGGIPGILPKLLLELRDLLFGALNIGLEFCPKLLTVEA